MKTLFDHLKAIEEIQNLDYYDTLDESDRKTFNVYMVNRFLSMIIDYIPVVNEIQMYWNQIGPRETYLFYSQILPRKRQYAKYTKSANESSAYEESVEAIVKQHFSVSLYEAREYLRILYSNTEGRASLRTLLQSYGCDEKLLKKAAV